MLCNHSGDNTSNSSSQMPNTAHPISKYIKPSHHTCWLYQGHAELVQLTTQFCIDGFAQNYQVVLNMPDTEIASRYKQGSIPTSNPLPDNHKFLTPSDITQGLSDRGYNVDFFLKKKQLIFIPSDVYVDEMGHFNPVMLAKYFLSCIEGAHELGFAGVRGFGDMTHAYGYVENLNDETFHHYEAKVNSIHESHPSFIGLCCYDQNIFPPSFLQHVLQTHKVAAVKDRYYPYNFYYVPYNNYVTENKTLDLWIQNLDQRNYVDTMLEGKIQDLQKQIARLEDDLSAKLQMMNGDAFDKELQRHKDSFVSNVSHEIRTPLTGIIGAVDLFSHTNLTPEQNGYLKFLQSSASQLSYVLSDIFGFTQDIVLHESKMVLHDSVVRAIKDARDINVCDNDEKDPTFFISNDVPPLLIADEKKIIHVLVFLISNSIKFSKSPLGGIHIDITLDGAEEKPDRTPGDGADVSNYSIKEKNGRVKLKFSVLDKGDGIVGDTDRLFDSFWEKHLLASETYTRTGLGLSMSKLLVSKMGGTVSARSLGVNCGFCVQFTIEATSITSDDYQELLHSDDLTISPLLSASSSAILNSDLPHVSLLGPINSNNTKILLVEDNPMNAKIILKLLQKLGYMPDLALNGLEAIEFASRCYYDYIFMDLHMPILDGFKATEGILAQARSIHPKIIALTASASLCDKQKCSEVGMKGFLSKPITINSLKAVLIG